ncbi:SDR family NAD(P)-dependent oxidoreductase [Micromonospora rifamycinica]|uniref:SDR family NAD(P)-dependent oxidoreductase n=1 Tax=Micromonospora rifamycinica TaxID=291594 RepID=UPI0033FC0FC3
MTRVVVVTGASSGIGRPAAREFAGRGDRLVLAARSPTSLAEVRRECHHAGADQVRTVPTDVTDPAALDALVGRVNLLMRGGFTVLPGVYDALVGPLMRRGGLTGQAVAPHEGVVFAPDPAGAAVRGGWLPELLYRAGTPTGATAVATAVAVAAGTALAAGGAARRRRR